MSGVDDNIATSIEDTFKINGFVGPIDVLTQEEAHAAFIIIRIVYGELRRKIFKFAREWIFRVEVPESQAIDRMTAGLIKAPNIILWLQAEELKQEFVDLATELGLRCFVESLETFRVRRLRLFTLAHDIDSASKVATDAVSFLVFIRLVESCNELMCTRLRTLWRHVVPESGRK